MTEEEYMQQVTKEWIKSIWQRIDDDPDVEDDFFDLINLMEEFE